MGVIVSTLVFLFLSLIIGGIIVAVTAPKRREEQMKIYNQYKAEYFKYAKMVDEKANQPEKLATEEFWNKIIASGGGAYQAAVEAKRMYQEVTVQRKEYNDLVNMLLTPISNELPSEENGEIIKLRQKFYAYYAYEYEYDSIVPFTNALKEILNDIQMKKDMFDYGVKKDGSAEELSDTEKLFLLSARRLLPKCEGMVLKVKNHAVQKQMYNAIEQLRAEQERQLRELRELRGN